LWYKKHREKWRKREEENKIRTGYTDKFFELLNTKRDRKRTRERETSDTEKTLLPRVHLPQS